MKHLFCISICIFFSFLGYSQSGHKLSGLLLNNNNEAIPFANIALMSADQSKLVKVETSNNEGAFSFVNIPNNTYSIHVSYIGYEPLVITDITIADSDKTLGKLNMMAQSIELEEAKITAKRAIVETKSDRTVFNVQGTINSAGDDALTLLRKAPGVLVDNNNNITVLARSGVRVYIDGKPLPLQGDDLTNYLQNLTAAQIDKIDIITNPGAKYEAEGNAGIIDIRLIKSENTGYNGSLSATYSKGIEDRTNFSGTGNYRNKRLNVFGTISTMFGGNYTKINSLSYQNNLVLTEENIFQQDNKNNSFRLGTDFFLGKNHTIGFLVSGGFNNIQINGRNFMDIAKKATPTVIDSVLNAQNNAENKVSQQTYNVNYQYQTKKRTISMDIDYAPYSSKAMYEQPNTYLLSDRMTILRSTKNEYSTPSNISIYSAKTDFEEQFSFGTIGLGGKYSLVSTDNKFMFYNIKEGEKVLNKKRSNDFFYDEKVYAGYANIQSKLSKKINANVGLRVEHTDLLGELQAYDPSLAEPPVKNAYTQFFPTAGITYQLSPMHSLSLNYGKRINRPNYNVLNPFTVQQSELSYSRGNAKLKPEIVHNVELGYTAFYRFRFTLAYSKTFDQITRLIAPDETDPRAGFISWDNLAEQTIQSFNASLPIQINKKWNMFINASLYNQRNQADYGNRKTIDLSVFSYNLFAQQTITLPADIGFELSGWYSGPGIWGGVFEYDSQWSLNAGLQRKFLNKKLNVKLSVQDIFKQAGWSGVSRFNGLEGYSVGYWDSRRFSASVSYNFGSSKIKNARKRKTGLDSETKRLQSKGNTGM